MPGIESDRAPAIQASQIADIGQMPTVTPAVGDFMKAFRDGFITVDDITKRALDKPVENSNRALALQANDFKSRRLTDAATMAPAELALQVQQNSLAQRKADADLRDLNANESNRPAVEAYKARQLQHAANMVSPDPKVREKAMLDDANFDLEKAYVSATAAPLPETIEIDRPAKVDTFDVWLAKTLKPDQERAVAEEKAKAPQEVDETSLPYLERVKQSLLETAGERYNQYASTRKNEKAVVHIGTPDYYKELSRRLTEGQDAAAIKAAKLKALPSILENRAKGDAVVNPHKTVVKRVNAKGEEEEVLVQTDPATGAKLGETVLSATPAKLTETQGNTQLFANRLGYNDRVLTALEAKGFDPTKLSSTLQSFLPNRFRSDEMQEYQAAKNNWISAVLRKESGAAISMGEYKSAEKEYFPQDGDSPQAVKQKQGLRKFAEEQLHRISGPGGAAVTAPAATALPPTGTRRVVQDGVTFEWDGTRYVPLTSPAP